MQERRGIKVTEEIVKIGWIGQIYETEKVDVNVTKHIESTIVIFQVLTEWRLRIETRHAKKQISLPILFYSFYNAVAVEEGIRKPGMEYQRGVSQRRKKQN